MLYYFDFLPLPEVDLFGLLVVATLSNPKSLIGVLIVSGFGAFVRRKRIRVISLQNSVLQNVLALMNPINKIRGVTWMCMLKLEKCTNSSN